MPTTYAGNNASYPASITIPSDGDGPVKAADVNAAFEGLADRTASLTKQLSLQATSFTASGTFTVPPNCVAIAALGCGAGGGGGGGGKGKNSDLTTGQANGGPAGAAAQSRVQLIATTPGETATVTIGAGGAGGAGGTAISGLAGIDGGSTTLAVAAGTLTWKGGQAAARWVLGDLTLSAGTAHLPGGNAPAGSPATKPYVFPNGTTSAAGFDNFSGAPNGGSGTGGGGHIGSAINGLSGNGSSEGYAGGAGGAGGGSTVTAGGPGGGGGGGGPRGAGGAGGAGGDGNGGAGGAGVAGSAAAANTGGGGGGGGAGGVGDGAAGGNGAAGAAGGSGHLTILYVRVPS